VALCSTVMTDEHGGYVGIKPKYDHRSVKHSAKEYVRKEKGVTVHTNTVESSFSLLKRGIVGSFHHVSKKHLPLYLHEFDFRWNHRKTTDGERMIAGIKQVTGKRLTYKPLIQS
jgi:ISXO2-like transposase domain